MTLSVILVKSAGVVLLGLTARSIWKHIKERKNNKGSEQSVSESILNNLLLYLWLAFMTVFSIGMMVNN
jgi:hypothetical protein